jgi:DHA1 family multidrug resistance protein-like MFS transporter
MPQGSFFPIYLDERLHYGPVTIATFVAAGQVAGMIAALVGGVLCDAVGSKRVLVLGLLGAALSSLVYQATAPWLLAPLWMIGGLAMAFHTLGGSSYLTRVADPRYLGVLAALYALCLTLGGALGNPAAGFILDSSGFRAFGFTGLSLATVSMLGTILFLSGLPSDRTDGQMSLSRFWRGALALVRRPVGGLLITLRYLPTVFYGMIGLVLPLMINRLTGSKATVAAYATVTLVIASGAQLLAGRAADRVGRRWPVFTSYSILILSGIGLAAFSGHLPGIFIFGVSGNAAAWALSALMFPLVSDGVPKAEHGRMFGLLHASWSIGMISGALLGGSLVRFSPGLPFLVGGLLQVLTVLVATAYFARVRRETENVMRET